MELKPRHVRDSYTEQVQILTQGAMNGFCRLFGGQLMQWIDIVAGVVARRHSSRNVTTAVVDSLEFVAPAYANETVILIGTITYAGRTSMEVCVRTYVEELTGERKLITTAYIVLVALDDDERPTSVPKLILETDEERREWENALRRNALRKQRREEKF